jgi:hypothetical protein
MPNISSLLYIPLHANKNETPAMAASHAPRDKTMINPPASTPKTANQRHCRVFGSLSQHSTQTINAQAIDAPAPFLFNPRK